MLQIDGKKFIKFSVEKNQKVRQIKVHIRFDEFFIYKNIHRKSSI